jgi:hypothetical protein
MYMNIEDFSLGFFIGLIVMYLFIEVKEPLIDYLSGVIGLILH